MSERCERTSERPSTQFVDFIAILPIVQRPHTIVIHSKHTNEQLIERLLLFPGSSSSGGARVLASFASDGVDFVDVDDAGTSLPRLLEQIAHASSAQTADHLHELRAGHGQEGNLD